MFLRFFSSKTYMFRAKSQQFIAYILKLYKHATVQNLMRLSFLTDCVFVDKTTKRISSFSYRLYSFGPFDESIFSCLENLIEAGFIHSYLNYTKTGLEYWIFPEKVDTVKRNVSHSVFHTQQDKDSPALSAFSAGCKRLQYTQKWNVKYPDDPHSVHDRPTRIS